VDGFYERDTNRKTRPRSGRMIGRWSRVLLTLLFVLCIFWNLGVLMAEEEGAIDAAYVYSVQVEGSQRVDKEAILAVIKTKKGDRIDQKQLDKDLRDIYRMRYFTDVKIEITDSSEGKIVVFIVEEKPSIGEIIFEGNKKVKDEDLKEEVGIKTYSILDYNEIKQSINRLTDFYRQKGYYNATIKDRVATIPNNEVRLIYEIAEHEKVYITKIEFLGNTEFDDGDLKGLMETSEKGFFSWISDSGYLDEKVLEFDVHKITSFYHNKGYIRARAGEPEIIFDKDKGLTITIDIEEGPQFGVNKVDFAGDLIKPAEELLESVNLDEEKIFNHTSCRSHLLYFQGVKGPF